MNKKILTGLSLSIASILLTACGGGGGGGSTAQPDNSLRYWHIQYNPTTTADKIDIGYSKVSADNKISNQLSNNLPLGTFILTESKLYKPTDIANRVIDVNSLTDWTSHIIGDVKSHIKYEQVDLTGKNIFDTVLPGYRSLGFDSKYVKTNGQKFLDQHGKTIFPQGSACFRLISRKNDQEYFSFTGLDTDLIKKDGALYPFSDFDQANKALIDSINTEPAVPYRYASGTWQDVPWTVVYETALGVTYVNTPAVQYQNKTYKAEYNSAIEYTNTIAMKQLEERLKNPDLGADKVRSLKLSLAGLQTGCDMYNEDAAKAIYSFQDLDWTKHE
ncbi:hypothetical protein [Acinetobacter gerneri]|uniref:hypothetical protein n=1 Tax=Acinetobacter gerneri TaxID=202952 RepID=UPI00321292DA